MSSISSFKSKKPQTILSEYEMKKTIGKGTFSIVKLGIKKSTKEKVAIKILEKSKIINKDDLIRIKREISILKNFNHKNIIKIYDIFQDNEKYYIIMEYCENGELFNYIVENQKLNEKESSYFYYQLINGLEYIHSKGVVHRDLKPENLLLGKGKILKIIDFGLSNYFNLNNNNLLSTPCGSPCYASPEMVSGKKYNGFYIDVWSTGIILYAMLCGYLPFEDPDNDILFRKISAAILEYPDHLSENSIDLMNKILVTDPERRIKINEIKKHPFYLQGKEFFDKLHPEFMNNDKEKKNKNNPADIGANNNNNINNDDKKNNIKHNNNIRNNNIGIIKKERSISQRKSNNNINDNKKFKVQKAISIKTDYVLPNNFKSRKYKNNNNNYIPNKPTKNNLKDLKYIKTNTNEKTDLNTNKPIMNSFGSGISPKQNQNKINVQLKRPYSKDAKIRTQNKRINTEHDLFEKEFLNKIFPTTTRKKIRPFSTKNNKKSNITYRTNFELFNSENKFPENKKITQSNITNTNSIINMSNNSNNIKTENEIKRRLFNRNNKKNLLNIHNKKQNSQNDLNINFKINIFNSKENQRKIDIYKTQRPVINNSSSNSKIKNTKYLFSNEFISVDSSNNKKTRKTKSLRTFNSSNKKSIEKNTINNNKKSENSQNKRIKKTLPINFNSGNKDKITPIFINTELYLKKKKKINIKTTKEIY